MIFFFPYNPHPSPSRQPPRPSHPRGLGFGPFRLRLAPFGSVWAKRELGIFSFENSTVPGHSLHFMVCTPLIWGLERTSLGLGVGNGNRMIFPWFGGFGERGFCKGGRISLIGVGA